MTDLTEIIVGVITRAHGVRGEVVVDLRTDEPQRRFAEGAVLHAEPGSGRSRQQTVAGASAGPSTIPSTGSFTVVRTREHQGRWLVTFAEVPDRTVAETLRGVRLVARVPVDERPEDAEEYYDRQLVGLTVIMAGEPVGSVRSVLHLPAQDVLEISTGDGDRLVPFVTELVPEIDLDNGRLVITDLPGLLDDEDDSAADGPAADDPAGQQR